MTSNLNTSPSFIGKFRHDGTHFVAIQKTTSLHKSSERNPVIIPYMDEIETEYKKILKKGKKKSIRKVVVPTIYNALGGKAKYEDVETQCIRLNKNYKNRKKTFTNKFNLNVIKAQKFNFFVTVTYDPKKFSSEVIFRWKLCRLWNNLATNHGWRQFGVFERGEKGERLHYHCFLFIPKNGVVGEFVPERRYSKKRKKMEYRCSNTYFAERFGINEFMPIDKALAGGGHSLEYLCKYAEKDNERFVYSRGIDGDFGQFVTADEILLTYNKFIEHLIIDDDDVHVSWTRGSLNEEAYVLDCEALIQMNPMWEKVFL